MRVMAVDPGKHSGWAVLDYDGAFEAGEADYLDVVDLADKLKPEVLVVEKYIIPPRAFNSPWSLEVIGALRWWARSKNWTVVVEQLAASAKQFADNDRLKRLGWYTKGSDHARDATRHLALYVATTAPHRLPKEIPMCTCPPRERIRNGDDPERCFRCAQPIPVR
ncbi:MAG: hypothetical protein L0Z49_14050 [Actinobacteria bacterium]|nr:hypothetical protein [Actinomycetota bacterium]